MQMNQEQQGIMFVDWVILYLSARSKRAGMVSAFFEPCSPGQRQDPSKRKQQGEIDMEHQNTLASGDAQAALSREELEQHVRVRAWKDDAFRQEFLAHPKAVLERDYAQSFPEGKIPSELSIKVVEENEQDMCFVLPPREPDALSGRDMLEEEDLLEVVGGGPTGNPPWCNTVVITCPGGRWCLREAVMRIKL
jgi:hypothetical protein